MCIKLLAIRMFKVYRAKMIKTWIDSSPSFVPTRTIGTSGAKRLSSGIHCFTKKHTKIWVSIETKGMEVFYNLKYHSFLFDRLLCLKLTTEVEKRSGQR